MIANFMLDHSYPYVPAKKYTATYIVVDSLYGGGT